MSDRTYRVIVRGAFTDLDEAQRAALLEAADKHDILGATFTDDGTLIYDKGATQLQLPLRGPAIRRRG